MINEIKKYSQKIRFQDLDLIKKLILRKEERKHILKEAIPKVNCPKCNSSNIEVEHSEDEYSDYHWLYCYECDEGIEDEFGYYRAKESLYLEEYFDEIEIMLDTKEGNITFDSNWEIYCRETITKMIKCEIE